MLKALFSILFLTNVYLVIADGAPKNNSNVKIEFWHNGSLVVDFDSILFITKNNLENIDSIFIDEKRVENWQNTVWKDLNDKNYSLVLRTKIDRLFILILYKDKVYTSDTLKFSGNSSYLKFKIQNNHLIDISPLFKARWENYFTSLLLTLFVELTILLVYLIISKNGVLKPLLYYLFINLFTHPSLWYLDSHTNIGVHTLELIIWIVEIFFMIYFFKHRFPVNKLWKIILIANLISYVFLGIVS